MSCVCGVFEIVGVCTPDCDNEECGYDGGDCTQTCDYSICDYTSLGDGICNPECRNQTCGFDYCDCFDYAKIDEATDGEIEQCSFNETLCDINTDCVVFITNTTESWIDDYICDANCDNQYCGYDGGECSECGNSICQTFWFYFDACANSETADEKASLSETCAFWDTITAFLGDSYTSNCTQFMYEFDLNSDLQLNGYETTRSLYMILFDTIDDTKANQINCSKCASSADVYYQ